MRRSAPLVLVAAVMALLAAGCRELPDPVGSPTGQKVVVIGDSMVVDAQPQITDALVASGYNVTVYAENGLDTPKALELIDQAVQRGAAAVVVITTANDAVSLIPGKTPEQGGRTWFDVRDTLDVAWRKLDAVPCTTWMRIDEHAAFPYFLYLVGPTMNQLVDGVAARRQQEGRRVALLDWSSMMQAHPEYDLGDGLHPNAAGSQRLAADINGSVAGCHT